MFKELVNYIREVFETKSAYDSLEGYIAAANPQSQADIERLEREFYTIKKNTGFINNY
jgi:hypothetical protein